MLATALAHPEDPTSARSDFPPRRRMECDNFADHLAPCAIRSFEAKDHIYRQGDRAAFVYRVEIGQVCIYRMLPDGRRQVIDFAYPGDVIGLGALGEHAASAQATSRTSVRCLPIANLRDLVRLDSRIGLKLYEAVSRELQAARELLFTVSQRTATERLAGFLLALSKREARKGNDASTVVLPMTRADIADLLGLTIETVSRTFTKFRHDGLIDLEQCILVSIKDPDGLATAAGEAIGGGF